MKLKVGNKYLVANNTRMSDQSGKCISCWSCFKIGAEVKCKSTHFKLNTQKGIFVNKKGVKQTLYNVQVTPLKSKLSKIREGILK